MKRSLLTVGSVLLCLTLLTACADKKEPESTAATEEPPITVQEGVHTLELSGHTALLDGNAVEEYDYTWHCDPTAVHEENEDAPAEYYTGTKPETDAAVYIDSDLCYVPALPEEDFERVNYDGDEVWAAYYSDGENDDYLFTVLPALGDTFPAQMMHSEEEAAENRVLHICAAGTYALTGTWNGQINVDLGKDVYDDPEKKVTILLNGVDITCTAAPGLLFTHAYECDNEWEDRETYSSDVDLTDTGVTVVIADGTENTVSGTNIARMLKPVWSDEDAKTQKKLRKLDGAFYSCVSMTVTGGEANTGSLTVNGGFEGLDSELHLSLAGGNITIHSQDDGINVNEDGVSVVRFDGANVEIHAAQGAEGDGVDSNGFIVVNDGTLCVNGIRVPDHALDSDMGVTYNGGTVIVDGETQTLEPGTVIREIGGEGEMPERQFDLAAFKKAVEELPDDATMEDILDLLGMNGGGMAEPGTPPEQPQGEMPDGGTPPEKPQGGFGEEPPAPPMN